MHSGWLTVAAGWPNIKGTRASCTSRVRQMNGLSSRGPLGIDQIIRMNPGRSFSYDQMPVLLKRPPAFCSWRYVKAGLPNVAISG
jgi:hypothetical protein